MLAVRDEFYEEIAELGNCKSKLYIIKVCVISYELHYQPLKDCFISVCLGSSGQYPCTRCDGICSKALSFVSTNYRLPSDTVYYTCTVHVIFLWQNLSQVSWLEVFFYLHWGTLELSLFSLLLPYTLVGDTEAQLSACWTPDHAVWAQAWAGVIVFCSSCSCFLLSFFSLGVTLWSIQFRGDRNTPSHPRLLVKLQPDRLLALSIVLTYTLWYQRVVECKKVTGLPLS